MIVMASNQNPQGADQVFTVHAGSSFAAEGMVHNYLNTRRKRALAEEIANRLTRIDDELDDEELTG